VRSSGWLWILLVGCHEVGETGPRGIRGVLVDADGGPIALQRIVSEDHGSTTDERGHFEVRWKDPTTFVDFRRGGLTWRRRWLSDRDHGVVTVQIPRVRDVEVACRIASACRAELMWDLGEGLRASAQVPCGGQAPLERLTGAPLGPPVARCASSLGEVAVVVENLSDRILVREASPEIAVRVVGVPDASACTVGVLQGEVHPTADGMALRIGPPTTAVEHPNFAWSICDGRVGAAVAVPQPRPGAMSVLELPAATEGVDLRLEPPLEAEPRSAQLVRLNDSGGVAWEQRVEPSSDGVYRFPRLERGNYRLGFGSPEVLATANPPDPEIPGTVLILARSGPWGQVGGYAASLRLEEDTPRGRLRVDGHPPRRFLADREVSVP
jgi:hypothetical protein